MKPLYITLICILSLVFLSLGSLMFYVMRNGFNFKSVERKEENIVKSETVSIENIKNLNVKVISGNLYVYEAVDNNIKFVQYSNKNIDKNEKFSFEKTPNSINIREERRNFFFNFGFANSFENVYELYIPKEYCENLKIESVSSIIIIENELCTKTTELSSTSGEISTKNIEGNTTIRSVSGRLNIGEITGRVELKTTSGSINFASIDGEATIKSVSGSINGEVLISNANVETTSGRIEINKFQVKEDSNFKSVSGSVNLGIFDSNCEIKAKSTSGKITLPNDSSIMGTSPYFDVNIKTTSGSIKIFDKYIK